ncbi:MAG TPA: site-2 protease family protein [Gemmatimonadaceae bacterium]|nr:site-2 protease family protein [Gemmatimonadaceae bacterium]
MNLEQFLLALPILLFSMIAHEYAHGYAALKQGDSTAYQLGRLTWNPIKHIDPFLTILMPALTFFWSQGAMIFGGAKPVPVVPRNYRNFKRGDIIVSLAGVAANAVIALACVVLAVGVGAIGRTAPGVAEALGYAQDMLRYGILINLVLIMFNLLPVPPLDGSHVMKYLLPPAWAMQYQRIGAYGLLILILLLSFAPAVIATWMAPVRLLMGVATRLIAPFDLPEPT